MIWVVAGVVLVIAIAIHDSQLSSERHASAGAAGLVIGRLEERWL